MRREKEISQENYYVLKQAIKSDAKRNSNSAVLSWMELNVPECNCIQCNCNRAFFIGTLVGVVLGILISIW